GGGAGVGKEGGEQRQVEEPAVDERGGTTVRRVRMVKGIGDHQGLVGQRRAPPVRGEQHAAAGRDPLETDRLDAPPVAVERVEERRRIAAQVSERAHRAVKRRAAEAGGRGERPRQRRAEDAEGRVALEATRGERFFDLALERIERIGWRARGKRVAASFAEAEGFATAAPGVGRTAGTRLAIAMSIALGHRTPKLGNARPAVNAREYEIDTPHDARLGGGPCRPGSRSPPSASSSSREKAGSARRP